MLQQIQETPDSEFRDFLNNILNIFRDSYIRETKLFKKFKEEIEELQPKNEEEETDSKEKRQVLTLKLEEWLLRLKSKPITNKINARPYHSYSVFCSYPAFRFILYGIIVLTLLFFLILPSVAEQVISQASASNYPCLDKFSSTTLCLENFTLNLQSPDIEEDKATIRIKFVPINFVPIETGKSSEIKINFGKEIELLPPKDSKGMKKINCSASNFKFEIKESGNYDKILSIKNMPKNSFLQKETEQKTNKNFSQVINRNNRISNQSSPNELRRRYQAFLNKETTNPVCVEYSINGSLSKQVQTIVNKFEIIIPIINWKILNWEMINRTVYLFPHEKIIWKIPMTIAGGQAVLSNFELEEPQNYYDSEVNFMGTNAKIGLKEENIMELKNPPITLLSGKPLALDAGFRQTDQAHFFYRCIMPLGFIVGILIGIYASLKTDLEKKIIALAGVNSVIAGIYSAIWGAIDHFHPNNPNTLKGGFDTVATYIFIISFLALCLTSIIICWVNFYPKWLKIAVYFIIIILIITAFIDVGNLGAHLELAHYEKKSQSLSMFFNMIKMTHALPKN